MKKIIKIAASAVMVFLFAAAVFAKASPMGEAHVPYFSTAPTLDGVLSGGEWDTSLKTTFSNKTATVAKSTEGTYDPSYFTFYFDIFYGWDETYLYAAWDVHADRKFFDQGGNYVRLYLDPGGAIKSYCDGVSNPLKVGMPRLVSATKSDGTGIYGLQQLGFDNINFENTEYGYKVTDYGWVFETRVKWSDLEKSVAAKTGNSGYKLDPDVGMRIRANYDYYDITADKSIKAFLTTYIDQQDNAKNVWNFSEYADVVLILDAEKAEEPSATGPSGGDTEPAAEDTGTSGEDTGSGGNNNAVTGDATVCAACAFAVISLVFPALKKKTRK